MSERRIHVVPESARGERLDHHLASTFADLSRSRLKTLIENGEVRVGGGVAKSSLRLKGGEQIELTVSAPVPPDTLAEALLLEILYEDPWVVVVNKAAGMVVHPGAGHWSGTLANALVHRMEALKSVGDHLRPGLVHRLDKETSGCLVVAKTVEALAALQVAFKSRQVQKQYLALARGKPKPEGRIETLFGRHPRDRKRFTGKLSTGKPAVTWYRIRECFEGASLLELDLLTGRTHQIRVHLSELGHPILGDKLYGKSRASHPLVARAEQALGRQALHAWRLSFPHPTRNRPVSVEAPLPGDFVEALKILRRGS